MGWVQKNFFFILNPQNKEIKQGKKNKEKLCYRSGGLVLPATSVTF